MAGRCGRRLTLRVKGYHEPEKKTAPTRRRIGAVKYQKPESTFSSLKLRTAEGEYRNEDKGQQEEADAIARPFAEVLGQSNVG